MMEDVGCCFRFGPFTLEVGEHRLLGPSGEIYLRPRTFETLRFLVERHGHLVTRETLFDSVARCNFGQRAVPMYQRNQEGVG